MSASCTSQIPRSARGLRGRLRRAWLGAVSGGLGLLIASPVLAADCLLQIAQAPPSVRLDYDPFVPAIAPSRLTLKIQNVGGEACEADLALTNAPGVAVVRQPLGQTGLMLELRPGTGVTRASLAFVFHINVPAGETLETEFDVVVIEDAVVQAGLYSQPLTLELRQPGASVAYDRAPVVIDVTALPRAQLNLSGSRGAFGTGVSVSVVDFGEAQTGKTRQLFVQTRTNSAARLTFTSANRGRLRLPAEGDADVDAFLDYAVAFEGGVLDLSQVATRDVDPPRTYAGQSYDLILSLGEVAGAKAGHYSDDLTIEISTL